MIPQQFANYNKNYQQRLGYLKLLATLEDGGRPGKVDLLQRIHRLYHPRREGRKPFVPTRLLEQEDIPSWQPGFPEKSLDRLVLWGQMLGVLTPAGRLSEWGNLLRVLACPGWPEANPFVLSAIERAFFLQLLL